ncbi:MULTISPECIES: hypothetical protein [Pseudomonas]|uniref:hypothetical protein n=1 Tax=Pseudomonas TaxID=286 RepID=UPI001297B1A3|nr:MULTISPECIES: hypothetical protein [Pseudomonas]MQT40470.1 hypothetical protein [Pseudomonas sp. FSL R10-0765]CAH0272908.1 hypothetical protein SRABI111_03728 [Pseudomonas carnis]CAH0323093.1 hypothetical protein SRABI08_05612 [Pseudomonas carnis]CAH0324615.1 hypothetical protein SRABI110_05978 [Pseudomonas carnis]CAH0325720.1 hypothetical protein SRABI64_06001 [Pseudomonas carnis]
MKSDREPSLDRTEAIEQPSTPAQDNFNLVYGSGDGLRPRVRERMVNERMRALFDDVDVYDSYKVSRQVYRETRLGNGMFCEQHRPPPLGPFELHRSTFLAKARAMRPECPEATASAFGSWVYSLYGRPGNDEDALKRGLEAEKLIFELGNREYIGAREVWTIANANMLARRGDGWRLMHQGLHLNSDTVPFVELDALLVRGQPLRASPDLVFRNAKTGHVLVVEIKLSRQSLPSNLWPNVWAQLWCYSHIPVARQAPRVTVTGEVWGETTRQGSRRRPSVHLLYLRAVVRRDPRATAYDRFFRELFDIYRGESPRVS